MTPSSLQWVATPPPGSHRWGYQYHWVPASMFRDWRRKCLIVIILYVRLEAIFPPQWEAIRRMYSTWLILNIQLRAKHILLILLQMIKMDGAFLTCLVIPRLFWLNNGSLWEPLKLLLCQVIKILLENCCVGVVWCGCNHACNVWEIYQVAVSDSLLALWPNLTWRYYSPLSPHQGVVMWGIISSKTIPTTWGSTLQSRGQTTRWRLTVEVIMIPQETQPGRPG